MKMKKYIIIAIIIVLAIGGYFVYQMISKTSTSEIQPELQPEAQIQPDETNGIYTVDELVESNIQEGAEVLVSGRYNMELISAGPDYEGPGSGDYLFGETKSMHLTPPLKNVELNSFIKVKGKVRFCGGKKIEKYVCGLAEVELVPVSKDKFPSIKDVDEICKANTKEECESNPDCYWKYQGGKITAHYNCCPKDKEKSPERCNIMVD